MGYRLIPTATFEHALAHLDRHVVRRIAEKLTLLEGSTHGILPLAFTPKGLEGLCKYKVGEWRVLLTVSESKKEIVLYSVKHRKDAYKNL